MLSIGVLLPDSSCVTIRTGIASSPNWPIVVESVRRSCSCSARRSTPSSARRSASCWARHQLFIFFA
jgi:hypothetical protein